MSLRRVNPMWHRLLGGAYMVTVISFMAVIGLLESVDARAAWTRSPWAVPAIACVAAGPCLYALGLCLVREGRTGVVKGLVHGWASVILGVCVGGSAVAFLRGVRYLAGLEALLGIAAMAVSRRLSLAVRGWDVSEEDARKDRLKLFGKRGWQDLLLFGIASIVILVLWLLYALS